MLGVLMLALAALALAFFALADDDPAPEPATGGAPAPGAPAPGPIPPAEESPAPAPPRDEEIASWPEGVSAWTVVLDSSTSPTAARRRAERLADDGLAVGILRSDDFSSLEGGSWLVFSGRYESSREAASALRELPSAPAAAHVERITPQ
jgi:hypothetical protein